MAGGGSGMALENLIQGVFRLVVSRVPLHKAYEAYMGTRGLYVCYVKLIRTKV